MNRSNILNVALSGCMTDLRVAMLTPDEGQRLDRLQRVKKWLDGQVSELNHRVGSNIQRRYVDDYREAVGSPNTLERLQSLKESIDENISILQNREARAYEHRMAELPRNPEQLAALLSQPNSDAAPVISPERRAEIVRAMIQAAESRANVYAAEFAASDFVDPRPEPTNEVGTLSPTAVARRLMDSLTAAMPSPPIESEQVEAMRRQIVEGFQLRPPPAQIVRAPEPTEASPTLLRSEQFIDPDTGLTFHHQTWRNPDGALDQRVEAANTVHREGDTLVMSPARAEEVSVEDATGAVVGRVVLSRPQLMPSMGYSAEPGYEMPITLKPAKKPKARVRELASGGRRFKL